jgi:2-C-methyl-D-erythritol 4-phosphate cytidylyltransferase/2-C-methyl-D-erythritol 2,4-cyclodiphosphate synthase
MIDQSTAVSPLSSCSGVAAIIPAAGFGSRMGTDTPKQFLELAGEPVLIRTIRVFLEHAAVDTVMVVLPTAHLADSRNSIQAFFQMEQQKLLFTAGGETRQQSVANGLACLPPAIDKVLVHDGARPLLTSDIIDRCLAGVEQHRAVIAAIPVKDTLKEVTGNTIQRTIDRQQLWQAQTPQAMQRSLLEQACEYAAATGFQGTDEASLLEHAGIPVAVVMGSEKNFKITRPDDLTIAAALLANDPPENQQNREQSPSAAQQSEVFMKIGHGFDAHRLVKGRKLILGGVDIPFHLGLAGHSDADVLVHALMDALLGALGAGDIGSHFPDNDDQYLGADSLGLLSSVMELVRTKKMLLNNADITVICEQPKLAPHLATMRENLAAVCNTDVDSINIKATTTEKMGFCGRGEGISAHAVVLLQS